MDNLLLFVMHPGKYIEPDKRTLVRLLRSLCTQHTNGGMRNHYTCFESGLMQAVKRVLVEKYFARDGAACNHVDGITDYHKDSIIDIITREWWVYNGMPTFMEDKTTGRYVRRMLRAHKMQQLIDSVQSG
jgi:hypothetical protein